MADSERRYWECVDQAMTASSGGKVEEAMAWLEEALRANPEGAEARNGRGELLWDKGRCEESLREFGRAMESQPEFFPAQLNRIEILIEEFQEHEEALAQADAVLTSPLTSDVESEVYYLKAKALFYLDDLEGALFLLRRAIQTHGDVGVYRGFEGQVLFELGRYEEALRSLRRADSLEPEAPHTLYHRALAAEHLGELAEAEKFFARAEELDSELYPRPVRMSDEDFEAVAAAAIQSLPGEIQSYVANCPVLIEDLPSRDLVQNENVSPQVLGLFIGVPASEPGASPTLGTLVRSDLDRVMLFKRNLEKVAMGRQELVEQIHITVKHEIGHFLGLDEEAVERLGLG